MGKLDNPDSSAPYLRLLTRLESLRHDRRFAFMFSDWLVTQDTLAQIVGRLLRIPVNDAGMRGGPPLCPSIPGRRVRGGQPGDYPARSSRDRRRFDRRLPSAIGYQLQLPGCRNAGSSTTINAERLGS
jgi:hypothetical protein